MPNTTNMHIPSNRVRDIEQYFHTELAGLYADTEIGVFTDMLFEAFLGWDKVHLLLHRDETINQSDLLKFHWAAEDLKVFRPIQYIIGHTTFCDLDIHVETGVLIPRPETEEIVSSIQLATPAPTIIDLCTGSGCIALALAARYPEAQIYGIDISEKALAVARDNAHRNHIENVRFEQCDILQEQPGLPDGSFDLIISNPPYVMEKERATMQPNVLDYEPGLALFVPDNDPLLFYRAIGRYATQHLSPRGQLVLEINEHLGQETCKLLEKMGLTAKVVQDFRGKERCVRATAGSWNR